MSCEPMLMQLLEAEPDELRRLVDTPLTRHLADCPKCAAVADRLIADTAQLAFAVRADAAIAVRPARRLARLWMVPGVVDEFVDNTTLGRHATTADIADMAAFLAGDGSRSVSGALLPVDAGASTKRYPDLPGAFARLAAPDA